MGQERPDTSPQLLTLQELIDRSRLSAATIHRLKKLGKIPYLQPAGKGGRLLFPADAIERAACEAAKPASPVSSPAGSRPHLSGPPPAWMRPST